MIKSFYKLIFIASVCVITAGTAAGDSFRMPVSPLTAYLFADPNAQKDIPSVNESKWITDIFGAVAFGDRKGELYAIHVSFEENKPRQFRWVFQPFMGVGNSRDEASMVVGIDALFKVPVYTKEDMTIDFEGGAGLQEAGRRSFPSNGTHFNWRPQLGFSLRYGDIAKNSMIFGVRYLHISHGGACKGGNPGVEEILLYTGFQIRF